MSDPFSNVNLLRIILESETDADSPGSEELMSQIRENWEVLTMLAFYTGDDGTATSDPPNDTTGILTDTGATYDVDEHNGRSLVMIDGLAAGNVYTIDDTTATTLVCTGDNLYADGVRQNDAYKVFYNLKHTSAHTHDDVDSVAVTGVAPGAITQSELATSIGSVSNQSTQVSAILPGGEYGFYPQIKAEDGFGSREVLASISIDGASGTSTVYITNIAIGNEGAYWGYARQRYITSSGEIHWIFIKRDKITKAFKSMYEAPDHPCFGNSSKPLIVPHPFPGYDEAKYEIIVINPSKEEVEEMKERGLEEAEDLPDRDILRVIIDEYEIDETTEPDWPDIPVTVGLPRNFDLLPRGSKVTPIKKIIPKPKGIKTAKLKLKE